MPLNKEQNEEVEQLRASSNTTLRATVPNPNPNPNPNPSPEPNPNPNQVRARLRAARPRATAAADECSARGAHRGRRACRGATALARRRRTNPSPDSS